MNNKTGELEPIQSNTYYRCVDCETIYPAIDQVSRKVCKLALCNGHAINKCPWCRIDSHPWQNGRGE